MMRPECHLMIFECSLMSCEGLLIISECLSA